MSDWIEENRDDLIAVWVMAARKGDEEAVQRLKQTGQGWRIDPANDDRQPGVVAKMQARMAPASGGEAP